MISNDNLIIILSYPITISEYVLKLAQDVIFYQKSGWVTSPFGFFHLYIMHFHEKIRFRMIHILILFLFFMHDSDSIRTTTI